MNPSYPSPSPLPEEVFDRSNGPPILEAALIVYERNGVWARALRQQLVNEPVAIRETRSLEECSRRLRESPASLVALEVTTTSLSSVFAWLLDHCATYGYHREFMHIVDRPSTAVKVSPRVSSNLGVALPRCLPNPQMRAMIFLDPSLAASECVLRSAGAIHVVRSRRHLAATASLILAHLQKVPQPQPSARQWTWSRLPWASSSRG
jgi:hypothetical protein